MIRQEDMDRDEYRLAVDITAKYRAKNDRCARQYIESKISRFLDNLDVTYQYVRINGEKPEVFGNVNGGKS